MPTPEQIDPRLKKVDVNELLIICIGETMNDLEINKNTTLCLPDSHGDIEIDMWTEESGNNSAYVSFEKLQTWVASIQEQIITVATVASPCSCEPDQGGPCSFCMETKYDL